MFKRGSVGLCECVFMRDKERDGDLKPAMDYIQLFAAKYT